MTQARRFALGGNSRGGLLLAGALAAVAGLLVFVAVNSGSTGGSAPRSITGGAETSVVTAKDNIAARTQITSDMLELTKVPANSVLPGALTSTDLVVGRVARIPVYKGEQLLQEKLASGKSDLGLSYIVPDGQRAMAVKVDKVVGAGGLIRPGDRVDVVAVVDIRYTDITTNKDFTDTRAFTIAQNIEVLAVEQQLENQIAQPGTGSTAGTNEGTPVQQPAAQPASTVVTLALTPDVTQKVLLSEAKGTIRLAVRAPGDNTIVPDTDTTFLSLADADFQKAIANALKNAKP
jgi:pilus assembly protein CpaB